MKTKLEELIIVKQNIKQYDVFYKVLIHLKELFKKNDEEILYIIDILINNSNIKDIDNDYKKCINNFLYKKYCYNKSIISKYCPNIKFKNSIVSFLKLLNKKRSIVLIDDIDLEKTSYYVALWKDIHSN